MSRARTLADYVSSGDELALKAPIAGPTFTGTVAIPNVANLETAVVANTAKVTNYNQTLADINALDVTELGTVTSANLANTAIVYPSGQVLNTANAAITDGSSVTHTAEWTDTGLSATLPGGLRQANAKVLMQYSVQFDCYYEESGAKCQCEDSIEGATYAEVRDTQSYFHLGPFTHIWPAGKWWHGQVVCTGFLKTLSNSVGDTYTVKVRAYRTDGTDVFTHYASVGETTRRSQLTIQEIAL